MPGMKRPAGRHADPIKSRCKIVKEAVEGAEECDERVQKMLTSTINVTVGALKASRHAFNERMVHMIGEVLTAEHKRLTKDVETKEAAFGELVPAKATREGDLEKARNDAQAKAEALDAAKRTVTESTAKLKEANAAVKEAIKAQKTGDEELEFQSRQKAALEEVTKDSLAPLLDGSAAGEDKEAKSKAVLDMGRSYKFDTSLLSTAEPVLQKEVADRGSFDATCLEQLQAAFAAAIAGIDEQLTAGAPGKAERAAAVESAEATKHADEASLTKAKDELAAAKEAKANADAAEKAATQSVSDFMPDMKEAGDSLDQAKEDLKDFTEGALVAYNELKDLKEGDFVEEEPEPAAKKARDEGEAEPEEAPADVMAA